MFELLAELGARRGNKLGIEVGVASDAPASVGCLGEEHPHALGKGWVMGGAGDYPSELGDGSKLLVAVESAGIREYLHTNVIVVAVDVG